MSTPLVIIVLCRTKIRFVVWCRIQQTVQLIYLKDTVYEYKRNSSYLLPLSTRVWLLSVCVCVCAFSVCCATINSESMRCACGFADSSIHVWPHLPSSSLPCHGITATPPSCDRQRLVGHSGPVYGTSFSVDGSFLLSSSEDCSVKLWDVQQRACAMSYEGHSRPIWDVSFGARGTKFASAGMDQTVRLWMTDCSFPMRMFVGHNSDVNVRWRFASTFSQINSACILNPNPFKQGSYEYLPLLLGRGIPSQRRVYRFGVT